MPEYPWQDRFCGHSPATEETGADDRSDPTGIPGLAGHCPLRLRHVRHRVLGDAEDQGLRRLLLDILTLPKLLLTGRAKLSDYKWDLIGFAGGVAFVVLFILFVQYVGSLF